ncbi:MarR family winged helix-turn-helix transcriptional regulator [Actinopolymorpha singaporensis]|uniref:DNA-binding transcriptional regulator, MarR family n=1 Tax=Actinopolymorpha singaporensis TaxID=117157 RepID=A0A1H1Y8S0_9ACTN|nr:MarR family transcriptional regulator [Actinopolymorpha singaporensis]SDT17817.1 DNA-binding transcriptional regulator, MarR family [Actinopolymorpha singaporensis]
MAGQYESRSEASSGSHPAAGAVGAVGVGPLARELRPLVYRLYDVVRRHSPDLGVTLTQGSVLSVLVHDGPQTMSVLAAREGVRQPSMTNVVSRLERAGYVRRRPAEHDRRMVVVSATDKARTDLARVVVAREEFLRERLTRLGPGDRQAVESALPALARLVADPVAADPVAADQ